ncbi:hypothetical protein AVEN_76415-1 [Araneus ventricosus]|uniref:Uncharacterized protein n=1 Tax=Araneus ventricosus TaxID=182803 RepID=A0A4Y2VPV3_ARAVE|nr:hypothetical protein AVEN_76415-1 [Araneus ventricosus]
MIGEDLQKFSGYRVMRTIAIGPNQMAILQQTCHKFVMTRVQACRKLTKASKSTWNELAASFPQACRANSLQIIAKTEYEHNPE